MNRILLNVLARFSLLCFFVISSLVYVSAAENPYYIIDGVLFEQGRPGSIDLGGRVAAVYNARLGFFYLKESRGKYYTGFLANGESRPAYELNFANMSTDAFVKRFFSNRDFAFILTDDEHLSRLSLNSGDVRTKNGVLDAYLVGTELVLLEKNGDERVLNCNGKFVPCADDAYIISAIVENRLAVLEHRGGKSAEVIDIVQGRNIYGFSREVNYKIPENDNFFFDAVDEDLSAMPFSQTESKIVFYKIFINGAEVGRTETGLSLRRKYFNAELKAGEYHIIVPERWELDRKREEYVRVNNINQPKPLRIYIPENRIITISLHFDGKEYRFISSIAAE